jgi:type III secretory pathway component EscT
VDHRFASHLAGSVAEAVVLASTLPLGVDGGAMRIARTGFTIVLVPVLLAADPQRPVGPMLAEVLRGALIGGALGLSAMIVFGAVVGAGSAIDAALMWAPVSERAGNGSPIGFLYQAGFAAVLFSAGGFTGIIAAVAKASAQLPQALATLKGIAVLGKVCLAHCAALAAPALLAQMIASLLAGLAARAAPQAGSILMSAPLILSAVLLVSIAGSSMLFVRFADLIRDLLAVIRG